MKKLQELIKDIFEEYDINSYGKDHIKIIDENTKKINIDYISYESLKRLLSGKYEKINFERVGKMNLGLYQLNEFSYCNNKTTTHIDTIEELGIILEEGFYNSNIYNNNNFNIIDVNKINLLRFIITYNVIMNNNLAKWTKFFSNTEIKEMYYYCSNINNNSILLNNLKIKTLIIEYSSIPGYNYEIPCFCDYNEIDDSEDFKNWFIEELDDSEKSQIKSYINSILDTNQVENLLVSDSRSDISYNIDGKEYYGVFNLKEYLKL